MLNALHGRFPLNPHELGKYCYVCLTNGEAEALSESLSQGHSLSRVEWKSELRRFDSGDEFLTVPVDFPASSLYPCGFDVHTRCHVAFLRFPVRVQRISSLLPLPFDVGLGPET